MINRDCRGLLPIAQILKLVSRALKATDCELKIKI